MNDDELVCLEQMKYEWNKVDAWMEVSELLKVMKVL